MTETGAASAVRASEPSPVLTALRQAPIGIAIFDRQMRYLSASGRYLTDQNLPADMPLVGRVHYDVFPGVPQHWRDIHAQALADGIERSHPGDVFIRPDGQLEWIRWSVAPWRTEAGEIGGIVLYTEVVTPAIEARRELEAAEARYRAVFDQVAMGVARVAPSGRFLEVNDRFCAIAGHSREALLAGDFQGITHPDDLAGDEAAVAALLSGERETYVMEKRYITAQGQTVWISLTVSLVLDAQGAPDHFVAVIEDIAVRKQAQVQQQRHHEQLRLMINELNHRVKNTLSTIQSMAAQTLRSDPDPLSAYAKFEARLLSLSQVHDLLTQEHWHGASLAAVAERALKPFVEDSAARVDIDGPDVWAPPGAALALAMLLHELATNATKYGALSTPVGQVRLSWAVETANEGEKIVRLTWIERDGPPVKPPERQGFGSRLIGRALRDLQGSAAMRFEPRGVVCDMNLRLPANGLARG
ncbi:MAG: PAS domain S-box protein [Caulobacter sp.]|nr:PAS domain S-box protein [Caulobacter sp.]